MVTIKSKRKYKSISDTYSSRTVPPVGQNREQNPVYPIECFAFLNNKSIISAHYTGLWEELLN